MKKKTKSPRSKIIYIVSALTLALLAFVIYTILQQHNSNVDEKQSFVELRTDMKDLQNGFSTIDSGWKYGEYCAGYGTDVTRTNSIVCFVKLTNEGTSQTMIQENYEKYLTMLNTSNIFTNFSPTQSLDPALNDGITKRTTNFDYDEGTISCELSDTHFTNSNTKGITLSCSGSSRDFHFIRAY